ncbi:MULTISPECIES: ankyrin repeat domain-containing protein [unclassified Enterococcus]|uniref:ankyrin repeat domain-containing protein n=1 Tax=unclassified Enterococcus TaxID=2608891 RepID=UPI001CE22AC8|nr:MULTISPECIES: ankyrin repeat domain-containing protein [unclassified Enterococcus]MCA5012151.1 tetratricopeptide repeat protein [Enterococcus sp. S23]MCA5015402.1 tetratricopeptide repeat protein [Enterococcus sp. S22(2020)]
MDVVKTDRSLLEAISAAEIERVHELLQAGADVSMTDEAGRSPLMMAVQQNNLALVKELLRFHADVNQKDHTSLSPFICAAANGFDDIVYELLQAGADLPSVNRFGGTALLPSSEKGYLKTVQLCLAAGVPVDHVNRLSWSALLEATILGDGGRLYRDVIRELVQHQADVSQTDDSGKNALDYARESGNEQLIAILEKKEVEAPFFQRVRSLLREDAVIQVLDLLEKQNQTNLDVLYYLGYTHQRSKDYQKATEYYKKGWQQEAEFAFYLANTFRMMGETEQALKVYDQAIKTDQGFFYRYHKSNFLRELGRHEAAVELMDDLLKDYPDRVDFYFHKANSLRSLNRHQEAIEAMDKAIQLNPDNPLFSEHKAQSLQFLKN